MDPEPGVTRDRLSAEAEWAGHHFILVDTGGLVPGSADEMERRIGEQVEAAMAEADLILFVTDAHTGVTDLDNAVATQLRKQDVPVLLVVNKVDTVQWESDWHVFYSLALGDPVPASAMTGRSTGDMLDEVVALLPERADEEDEQSDRVSLAFLGRPNVGKSSLVNALVGRDTVIVDNVPGTTRDSTDTPLEFEGRKFWLIDTAGLRKQKQRFKSADAIEYYSVLRSINALERCEVAAVLVDSLEHLVKQDMEILDQVIEAGKALVIVANKWDTVPNKTTETAGDFMRELWVRYPQSKYFPTVLISAETGQRITRVLDEAVAAHAQWQRREQTAVLNDWLAELNRTNPPPSSKAGYPRIKYVTQVAVAPPQFVFFVNDPNYVGEQAERYLERSLRERFGFQGTPIRLKFRRK